MFGIGCFKYWPVAAVSAMLSLIMLAGPAMAAQAQPDLPAGYYALPPYNMPARPTALDKKLLAVMEEYKVVGLSATVFNNNKIVWSGGYGWADLATRRPVSSNTIFRVASLSKMVTATALMQLYDKGKFGLDDDIGDYLGYQIKNPAYPDKKITFRQLLTHTSSIVDGGAYDTIIETTPELLPAIDIKELLVAGGRHYNKTTFASYAPGSHFSYSNFGTAIAGSLVEKISGMPFDKYCSQFIFKPLSMDASFNPGDLKEWKNIAILYRPDKSLTGFRPTRDNYAGKKPAATTVTTPLGSALGYSPAGGLRVSSRDFSRFMQAHMNGGSYNRTRILKSDTASLMHKIQWSGNSMGGFYKQKGLNFHITDDLVAGKRLIGHSGEAYGLVSDAYYDPASKIGVVFMLNGANLTDASPYYRVENVVAKTLFDTFAPGNKKK